MKRIEMLNESKDFVVNKLENKNIDIAIILGSGLGDLVDSLEDKKIIDYSEIPYFPKSTVEGHKGRLVFGKLSNKNVLCMQGRFHYYENYDMKTIVYPVQMFKLMGINNLIVTNAAGGVNTSFEPGDLMLITDHIKLISDNPLRGENLDFGPRFFDMSNAYSKRLQNIARESAKELDINLKEGVYQFFAGPSFETPAEVKLARLLGCDAVGMSTVPEVIAASHAGIEVLGFSCITNMASGILDQPLNHQEVLETGQKVKQKFSNLVKKVIEKW